MHLRRLLQDLHHPLLPEKTHRLTRQDQATRLRSLHEDLYTGTVPQRAHVHPHTVETLQVRLRRLWKVLQTSREALHAQEDSPEHHLHCSESQEAFTEVQTS